MSDHMTTTVDIGNGRKALIIGGGRVVVLIEESEPVQEVKEPDPVINQYISWDTHGSPDVRGNERRSGYITALPTNTGAFGSDYYSIRGTADNDTYSMKRARFIAHFGYDNKTPSLRK